MNPGLTVLVLVGLLLLGGALYLSREAKDYRIRKAKRAVWRKLQYKKGRPRS